jgi:hypothetical protein
MVGRAREVLPQSPTLSRGNLRLVGGDVSLVSLIPPVSLIGNTSAMFRGTAKIFTELLQHPSGNNGCHRRGTTHKRRSAALVQRRSVLHDADAPVPSCTPADGSARLARGGSRHADTIDHYPADATAHTGLGGHTIGLMNRRDRHCLCGASERQPEQSNRYSSDHCFLPVVSE